MKTGDTCPTSGIWASDCCSNRIALSKGERFPPCNGVHRAANWTLIQATK